MIVFLDLAKAFDTVSHDIFLQKLELYGISGLTLNWIKSYLSKRKQLYVVEGSTSQPRTVTCGVPHAWINARTTTLPHLYQ